MTRVRPRPRAGALRVVSGVLAAGLAVLAVAHAVVGLLAAAGGVPGPGIAALAWHGGGAVLALAGQVYADRTPGRRGALVAAAVIAVVVAVLVVQWLV